MGRSGNNKHNRKVRQAIQESLDRAIRLHAAGDLDAAKRVLDAATSGLKHTPWPGGEVWDNLYGRFLQVKESLDKPCDCWFCCCDSDQKRRITEATALKEAHLSSSYATPETNLIGAYAEVVFGVRFGLNLNLTLGYDGGKDFEVHSTAGVITIDVKGTAYCKLREGMPCSQFPYQSTWKKRRNHIYVLLQIAGRKHVFFRGFAHGDDPYETQLFEVNGRLVFDKAPRLRTSLDELEKLLTPAKPGQQSLIS